MNICWGEVLAVTKQRQWFYLECSPKEELVNIQCPKRESDLRQLKTNFEI